MDPTIYKPGAYKTPGVYTGAGGIYKGRGVYNDGGGGGGAVIGGRTYKVVNMPDGKIWLAEDLDFKFSGCDIGPAGSVSTPAAWYYNNDETTYSIDGPKKVGLLYNYYAATLLETNKDSLCPGWHVPTLTEWENLRDSCGGWSVAGEKLKSKNDSLYPGYPTSWNGTDEYGFNWLPTGYRGGGGSYNNIIQYGIFQTLTSGRQVNVLYNSIVFQVSYNDNKFACPIRLVHD